MVDYTILCQEIEAEYEASLENPNRSLEVLYEKLSAYLKWVISLHIKKGIYIEEGVVEELTQETLLAILEKGLTSFEQRGIPFFAYCRTIAKNKVVDWIRKQSKVSFDDNKEVETMEITIEDNITYRSPEQQILAYERRLEQIALLKEYLKLLMEWPQKPYRTVGCGFTLVLFHRYHPRTKELSSPSWAFGEVRENTVEEGADRFITEMQEWFPNIPFLWSADFMDSMDEQEEGIYICDMIFGEHFQVKDFENWSRRLQPKIKKCLLEINDKEVKGYAFDL